MVEFIREGEHRYYLGTNNIVQGIDIDLARTEAFNKIKELFPDYVGLTDELHLNLMLAVRKSDNEKELAEFCYTPFVEICFVPEKDKKLIHVHVKKRSPKLGCVIFKDSDTFYENDSRLSQINDELINILVDYYEYVIGGGANNEVQY